MRLCAVFSVSTRSQLFGALAVRANQRVDKPGTHVLSETSAAGARPLNGRWFDPTDHVINLGPRLGSMVVPDLSPEDGGALSGRGLERPCETLVAWAREA